ncbi:MAG: hypothetical protein RML15_02250 [Bacteroidota bacterium]|nr:hypothetical protein [Candidatus Kapabacteria bacterium]MCS7302160.1 hypothetical protein [Candidatus Kapabacteria bacterium]MCX7936411.1 hypothetical protein [Chlorobiota bacterium]MDW8074309.1 hypothetical protein [Bacteroidota bacterium]MDW8271215.1 hypothetical protein [Bacteroidota bacterium]
MKNRRIVGATQAIIATVLGALIILALTVPTPSLPEMRTADVFDTTFHDGFRWIVASVHTNVYDSAWIARYATMFYHRAIPKHMEDTGAVQVELYFFNPDDRRMLQSQDIVSLARRGPAIGEQLGKLSVVDSGYVAVRFSSTMLLFGYDTLTVMRTRIYVPKEGYRWASLVRRLSS